MDNVFPLHGDPHESSRRLLPWYLTDTLEPAERARVEAHLATCEECRAELAEERLLRIALSERDDAVAAGDGWDALRQRALQSETPKLAEERSVRRAVGWTALFIAAPATLLLGGLAVHDWMAPRESAEYHGLASTEPGRAGNIIVMFRPDVPERQFRTVLNAVDARFVDGPTAAGAYVLSVPAARRTAVLGLLRERPDILLAQPLDGAEGQ